MCGGEDRKMAKGVVERCEEKLDELLRLGGKIYTKVSDKNGDHIRSAGDRENTEFINDRTGGTFQADSAGENSLSLIYEEGRLRSLGSSDGVLPPKQISIHLFSDAPLAVFSTDGGIVVRGVRRKEDT